MIHPTAIIGDNVNLGNNVSIGAYCVIGANTQFKGHAGEVYPVTIGDNTTIYEHVVITLGTEPGGTNIGSGCHIASQVHIGHDCNIGDGVTIAPHVSIAGFCTIGDESFIGMNASIHQRSVLPRLTMLGAGSFFYPTKIPEGAKLLGVPAKVIGKNTVGIERSNI